MENKEKKSPKIKLSTNHLNVGLLSLIASLIMFLNIQLITFVKDNSKDHEEFIQKITQESYKMDNVYKYEIHPNTIRSIKNSNKIFKLSKQTGISN